MKDSVERSLNALITPIHFNLLQYISYLQYFEGDRAQQMVRGVNVQKANIKFVQTIVPEGFSRGETTRHFVNIERGKSYS